MNPHILKDALCCYRRDGEVIDPQPRTIAMLQNFTITKGERSAITQIGMAGDILAAPMGCPYPPSIVLNWYPSTPTYAAFAQQMGADPASDGFSMALLYEQCGINTDVTSTKCDSRVWAYLLLPKILITTTAIYNIVPTLHWDYSDFCHRLCGGAAAAIRFESDEPITMINLKNKAESAQRKRSDTAFWEKVFKEDRHG